MMMFDPFAQWNKGLEMMTKMQTDAMNRVVAFYAATEREVEKLEAHNVQLASEWRRLSLEAIKSLSPKA